MQQTDIETDIEAALIGCLLLDYHATMSETADFSITPEMFVSGLARQTFEAIQSLAADKSPVDPLTVRQKLGRYGEGGDTGYSLMRSGLSTPKRARTSMKRDDSWSIMAG